MNAENQNTVPENRLVHYLIRERTVMTLVLINALLLFLDEFPSIHKNTHGLLLWLDYGCILFFCLEAALKIKTFTWAGYWESNWNRFDFIVVILSLPTLLAPVMDVQVFSVFLVLRVGRLLRSIRLLRFIPNAHHMITGVGRSLRASVGIFATLFILNLTFAIGATILFQKDAPEFFGNPMLSLYSLFKVFTVEGWFEIPDQLAAAGKSINTIMVMRIYFVAAVICGGILGLSLANAIFVDEMTSDNTQQVEQMVEEMHREISQLQRDSSRERREMLELLHAEIRELRAMLDGRQERDK